MSATEQRGNPPDTTQILCTTTTNENNGMFLQVVTFSWDVCNSSVSSTELHTADLTDSRVGLTRLGGVHLRDDCLLLEAVLKQRRLGLLHSLGLTGSIENYLSACC